MDAMEDRTKGFTLIELLIVIAIIGILAMLAIPAYVGQQKSATRTEAYSNLQNLRLLEEQSFAEEARYAPIGGGTINYNATIGVNDNGIEDALPGFRPGGQVALPGFGLNFTYTLTQNSEITDATATPPTIAATATPCFVATATGRAGTRVAGDVFAIDCNNNRNF
jgi:prepilin-type N-terminal cleavage/methylation domain-containing protein